MTTQCDCYFSQIRSTSISSDEDGNIYTCGIFKGNFVIGCHPSAKSICSDVPAIFLCKWQVCGDDGHLELAWVRILPNVLPNRNLESFFPFIIIDKAGRVLVSSYTKGGEDPDNIACFMISVYSADGVPYETVSCSKALYNRSNPMYSDDYLYYLTNNECGGSVNKLMLR